VSLWVFVGLVILCAARSAGAERTIVIEASDAPFAASDLAAAIRVRVPSDGASIRVRIITTERGVQIAAAGGVREIELLGLRGPAAARLVALAADDLLPDDLALVPVERAPGNVAVRTAARPAPARADRTGLAVLGAMAAWDGVLGGLAFDATRARGRGLVALELGGGQLVNSQIHLTAAVLRVGAGVRAGILEARLGLTAVPVVVTNGVGDQTVLLGGNASARARIPLAPAVFAIVAAGADVMATRTVYRFLGIPAMTTPWFAPWLAAGVEIGL
jgi:hypothetical protein